MSSMLVTDDVLNSGTDCKLIIDVNKFFAVVILCDTIATCSHNDIFANKLLPVS